MDGWVDGTAHCCFWHGIMETVRFQHDIHDRSLDGLEGKGREIWARVFRHLLSLRLTSHLSVP